MNLPAILESQPWALALGWTLLHFVWQGALIAALTGALLGIMHDRTARARYALCCAAMALMFAAPAVTFLIVNAQSPGPLPPLLPDPSLLNDAGPLTIWERLVPALPWLTLFWFCGTLLLQVRIALHWTGAQRMKTRGIRPVPPEWRRTLGDLCLTLGIKVRVRLVESSLARVPMVIGWVAPVILVPAGVLSGLPPQELRAVLAHELAHIRRHDYIINLVQALFEALLFYHPAVWWLSNRIRTEREYCCDDVAVNACRDALCYARALSSLDALGDVERGAVLASTGGSLMDRIFRLLEVHSKGRCRLGGWLAPLLIALFMTAAVSAMTLSDTTAPGPDDTEILSTATDDGSEEEKKPGKYKVKGPVCAEEVKALIKKLEAKGKTEKEIQQYLDQYCIEATKKAEAEKKRAAMKGKTPPPPPKSLEQSLVHLNLKAQDLETMRERIKKDFGMKIWKVSMSGKSEEEVQEKIQEIKKKGSVVLADYEKEAKMLEKKRQHVSDMYVKELRAKGLSDDKIKQHLKKVQLMVKETRLREKEEQLLIQKMQKKGMSKKEIKKALEERRKKAAHSEGETVVKKAPPPGKPQ